MPLLPHLIGLPHSTAAPCICWIWHKGLLTLNLIDMSLRMHASLCKVGELCRCGGVMASSSG